MKTKYLFSIIFIAAFCSCTTLYKTGQTPDDVYFSPTRAGNLAAEETADQGLTQPLVNNNYYTSEDRMIRLGISNYRYRTFNNNYLFNPYNYSLNNNFGNDFGMYYGNNFGNTYGNFYGKYYYDNYSNPYANNIYQNIYYNPYPIYLLPSRTIKNTTPRTTNLNGYGQNYNNSNTPVRSASRPTNDNSRQRTSSLGTILNNILTPSNRNTNTYNNTNNNNNNNNNNSQTQSRTYTPPPSNNNSSSGSSSSGSSGSSGSGRISRPQ